MLDDGFVRLDAQMGDDLSVVNAARVSFGSHADELDERNQGLVRFLMRERHGTPFEHNAFRFHVRCPIFVAREWFRHRVGSFNELSGRYTELAEAFYVPAAADVRTQVGKPGAYTFEPVEAELAEKSRAAMQEAYASAYATYRGLLDDGVAKEVARSVLPVGIYTEFFWTVNARSIMHFLSLRNERDGAARDPRVRGGRRGAVGRPHAGHPRRLRRERPHRPVGRRSPTRDLRSRGRALRHGPETSVPNRAIRAPSARRNLWGSDPDPARYRGQTPARKARESARKCHGGRLRCRTGRCTWRGGTA